MNDESVKKMLNEELKNIHPTKHHDLFPILLNATMDSFKIKDRVYHEECMGELKKLQDFYTDRIERVFKEVLDPDTTTTLNEKISILQILIHEIDQMKRIARRHMRVYATSEQWLQYPIPATVQTVFFFYEKEKCLAGILENFLDQQKEQFEVQVHHIRKRIHEIYLQNKANVRQHNEQRIVEPQHIKNFKEKNKWTEMLN